MVGPNFKDRVALVSGGNTGIGAQVERMLNETVRKFGRIGIDLLRTVNGAGARATN